MLFTVGIIADTPVSNSDTLGITISVGLPLAIVTFTLADSGRFEMSSSSFLPHYSHHFIKTLP